MKLATRRLHGCASELQSFGVSSLRDSLFLLATRHCRAGLSYPAAARLRRCFVVPQERSTGIAPACASGAINSGKIHRSTRVFCGASSLRMMFRILGQWPRIAGVGFGLDVRDDFAKPVLGWFFGRPIRRVLRRWILELLSSGAFLSLFCLVKSLFFGDAQTAKQEAGQGVVLAFGRFIELGFFHCFNCFGIFLAD